MDDQNGMNAPPQSDIIEPTPTVLDEALIRRIAAEEALAQLQNQSSQFVTPDMLQSAIDRVAQETRAATERRVLQAQEEIQALINRMKSEMQDILGAATERIEKSVQDVLGLANTSLQTQLTVSSDNNRRIGQLEIKDDEILKRLDENREEISNYRTEHDESLRRMRTFNDVLLGDPATGRVGIPARLDKLTGSHVLIEGEFQLVKAELNSVKTSVDSIEKFFNAVRESWHIMTRTTARKVTTGVVGTFGISVIVFISQQVIPTILKILGG